MNFNYGDLVFCGGKNMLTWNNKFVMYPAHPNQFYRGGETPRVIVIQVAFCLPCTGNVKYLMLITSPPPPLLVTLKHLQSQDPARATIQGITDVLYVLFLFTCT